MKSRITAEMRVYHFPLFSGGTCRLWFSPLESIMFLYSNAIKKVCFQQDPKGSVLFENRPENQITRISTRDAEPVSAAGAAAEEPVYDACAPVSAAGAAGAAEAVSREPVSELLSAAEPVWGELLSAAGPVWPVRPSDPGHTADSASGPDRAMAAAERPAPRRH